MKHLFLSKEKLEKKLDLKIIKLKIKHQKEIEEKRKELLNLSLPSQKYLVFKDLSIENNPPTLQLLALLVLLGAGCGLIFINLHLGLVFSGIVWLNAGRIINFKRKY